MQKLLLLITIVTTFCSCKEKKIIYVASYTQVCQGVATQTCLLIKESEKEEWQLFYDQIEGFDYELGYNYQLEVEISTIDNPPADGSSLIYQLIKIISKEKDLSIPQQNTEISNEKNIQNIEYQAVSRGFSMYIKIDSETIQKTNDINRIDLQSKKCPDKDWKTMLSIVKSIAIQDINELKAPTAKRLFDGAPHALLKISTPDQTYISSGFDHGTPPEEIKPLINHILSLSESIE